MTGVLMKRGSVDTDKHTGRMSCEHEIRDWGDVSTSQEAPQIASKPLGSREEAWKRFFLIALKRNNP